MYVLHGLKRLAVDCDSFICTVQSFCLIMLLCALSSRCDVCRTAQESSRLKQFEKDWEYDGDGTCAADGMCEQKCPVKINTGEQSVLAFFWGFFFLSFFCL